jgi:hypothetical protein
MKSNPRCLPVWPDELARWIGPLVLGLVGFFFIALDRARAADFTVISAIHAESDSKPVTENRTWFLGDRVYDELIGDPREVSVLDLKRQSIELLDVRRRIKTTLTLNELTQFVAALKVEALQAKSPLVRFAASPQFEVLNHEDQHRLRLKSDLLEYEVDLQPCDADVAQQYKRFCDWYARLNATRVGSLPPHARLELNDHLRRQQCYPIKIKLTIRNDTTSAELTSHHRLVEEIASHDRQRIEQIDLDRVTFREVSLADFRGLKMASATREK